MSPLLAIARNALVEAIRQPVHAVLGCLGLLALIVNVNVAGYTLEDDNKLLVDLGLSTLFLVGLFAAAFCATSVLSREIENKTVLTVISKPIPRWMVVVGKFLGVSGAIVLTYWLLSLTFLLTVRHRVQSSVRAEDTFDGPVITFGLLALATAFGVAALANYLYRSPFPSVFSFAAAAAATVAYGIVSCIDREWRLQPPTTDLDPQLLLGLVLVLESLVVLTAVALAASTRLNQISTLVVCLGVFLLGLVGEYFLSLTLAGTGLLAPAASLVPNLQFFWPAEALTQGHPMTLGYVANVTLYAACLVSAAVSLAVILFQGRDVG